MPTLTVQIDDSTLDSAKRLADLWTRTGHASKDYTPEHLLHAAIGVGLERMEAVWKGAAALGKGPQDHIPGALSGINKLSHTPPATQEPPGADQAAPPPEAPSPSSPEPASTTLARNQP